MQPQRQIQGGFTLVEMIVVMVITGIIGGMVAVFIRAPVQGYLDSAQRTAMSDIADTALRRLARDMRTAVPNSVRVPNPAGINSYIEFLPTRDGGRYRGAPASVGPIACISYADSVLDFNTADDCFEIIGPGIPIVAGTDYIVIGSTQSNAAPPYDQTVTGILRMISVMANGNTTITFAGPSLPFWAEVPGQRFDVVDGAQQAVTYACLNVDVDGNGDGTGTLTRYWGYGFNAAQAAPAALVGSSAILADRVSACEITYDAVSQRNGLVSMRLEITRGGESISLYHTVHVNNTP